LEQPRHTSGLAGKLDLAYSPGAGGGFKDVQGEWSFQVNMQNVINLREAPQKRV